jgi:predicted enzyme related to lactoylglutathione lyase
MMTDRRGPPATSDRLVPAAGAVFDLTTTIQEASMSTSTKTVKQISLVCLPTMEQDEAIAFYESIGFEKRTDTKFGGDYRWVEVYPPEGTTGIALAPPPPGQDAGPVQTGITLTTDDIDATHAELKSLGVDVDAEVARMGDPVPPMFWFRDPTGHALIVVEEA